MTVGCVAATRRILKECIKPGSRVARPGGVALQRRNTGGSIESPCRIAGE